MKHAQGSVSSAELEWETLRKRMVADQIVRRGVKDPRVLAVMETLPRHLFVPAESMDQAYTDNPVPIGLQQTISQPYMVASMSELLAIDETSRVLEIGTGSGYQTAVLARLVREVYTIELEPELSARASSLLTQLQLANIQYRVGDGSAGWPEAGPFDRIIVTATADQLPQPLVAQLGQNGRMILPLRDQGTQEQWLTLVTVSAGIATQERLYPVRFVPLRKGKS
jgi:protein-L-isoaspartate(D-aspartate) O-methyltransferase